MAVRTYKDLQDEVLGWLDEVSDTGTTRDNVKNAIIQAHQARLASEDWPFLRWDSVELITCETGVRTYPLHLAFWRPEYFFNRDTKSYLVEVPGRSLAGSGARWNDDTNRPMSFRMAGRTPVQQQPDSAGQAVRIYSSSASDTGATKAITLRGYDPSGNYQTDTISPSGATPVAASHTYAKITGVTKAAEWVGTMSLEATIPTTLLLALGPTEFSRSYQQIELLSTPQSADVLEYRFFRLPSPLSADNDIPDIPEPHEQVLVWDALLMIAGYNTDVSQKAITTWKDNQARAERALILSQFEGHSLEAQPRYTRYIEEDSPAPRIYR